MEKQRPDFLMKVYSTQNAGELLSNLNQILNAQISWLSGGKYKNCDVAIFPQELFDPTKPADFENDNYYFDMFVTYADDNWSEDTYISQVALAQKFKTAFESLGCLVDGSFYFMLPDGSSPNDLFEPK